MFFEQDESGQTPVERAAVKLASRNRRQNLARPASRRLTTNLKKLRHLVRLSMMTPERQWELTSRSRARRASKAKAHAARQGVRR